MLAVMENDALKPEPTYKSFNCTTCSYNCIVGQTYIDSVPVPFYPLCCVTDADGYRPSCLLSTQLDVDDRRAVDNALTLEQRRLVVGNNLICPQRPIQWSPIGTGFY